MDEQAQKRSTDCLYFLASPLTCKKGSECEYRHSESARLNPRDCWYWLNGNCLNPNCAFRHPPLEGFNGDKADSFYTPFSAAPTSKLNVACYFYFNAICAKGDQCPYLHDTFPTQKVSRVDPEAGANYPLENKISSGDTGPASVELPANPPAETLVLIKTSSHLNEVSQQAVPSCAPEEHSPSAESILPECEELADNRVPSLELMDHNDQLSPYQSFEEVVKECVEQELDERWESSPGFDVLVDGGSEQLAYEDDVDFQLAQNRESELVHSHLPLEYDFDGSVCYDHIGYPDTGYLYDELYENYDHTDDIYAADYFQHSSELPREERVFEPMYDHHRKQKLLRRVHEVHARDDVMDLREHLKYSRMDDARWLPLNSRKRHRSHARGASRARSQERPTRRGINGSIHCRLASQVGRCMITSSQGEDEDTCKDHDRQGWKGHSGTGKFARSRLRERERRRHKNPRISSEVQQSSALDAEESAKTSSNGFAGPKTLAQIKEEKSRARVKADYMNSQDFIPQLRRRQAAVDFEGPKPLEELLRDKRRSEKPQDNMWAKLEHVDVSCQVKNRTSDAEINDWHHEPTAGKQDREFVNGYQDDECADAAGGSGGDYDDGIDDDDDVDDDDVFRTKLARILSH